MKQLELEITAGGDDASSQHQANDPQSTRPLRQQRRRSELGAQLHLPIVIEFPLLTRPATLEECERRQTWIPYCPHVSCQYNVLIDVVNGEGMLVNNFAPPDGPDADEIDLALVPKMTARFRAGLLDPEDRPSGASEDTVLQARIPATCALKIAQSDDEDGSKNKTEMEMTFKRIGEHMGISKERARQLYNEAVASLQQQREEIDV